MINKISLFFLFLFPGLCFAKNNLPACNGVDVSMWSNCFGTEVLSHGYQFSGQYQNGKLNGLGVHYTSNGSVIFAGKFRNGNWGDPMPLDLRNFPFLHQNKNLINKQIFDTHLCHRKDEIGYIYKGDKWERTFFNLQKAFFLNINSKREIDFESFSVISIVSTPEKCTKPYVDHPQVHQCSGVMSTFTFNDRTLEGAFAVIAGGSQTGNRDTIATGIFKCQKIN